jgi:hypothetical protein
VAGSQEEDKTVKSLSALHPNDVVMSRDLCVDEKREGVSVDVTGISNGSLYATAGRQAIKRSLCLSVEELFLIAYMKQHYRKQGETWQFKERKTIYSRCCLAMGNCECSLSRPLRPAIYASLPKEFVHGCVTHDSFFGRNFDKVWGIDVRDLESLWMDDAVPQRKIMHAYEIAANWAPTRRSMHPRRTVEVPTTNNPAVSGPFGSLKLEGRLQCPLPAPQGGEKVGIKGGGEDKPGVKYVLSRHDVGKMVEIIQDWKGRDGSGANNVVRVKLRKHAGDQQFMVEFLANNVRQVLDFSRLEYQVVKPAVFRRYGELTGVQSSGSMGKGKVDLTEGSSTHVPTGACKFFQESAANSFKNLQRNEGLGVAQETRDIMEGGHPQQVPDVKSIKNAESFKKYAEMVADISIKSSALARLYELFKLLREKGEEFVVEQHLDADARNNCVLGFNDLVVKQPEFNNKIRQLVDGNKVWHGPSGSRDLKKVCTCVCVCVCVLVLHISLERIRSQKA